jgi:2-dehydro-3-deoxyphosphogluconate aldolase/(4S)-4-hydroxy-2-oxoglutarate aldolase
VIVSRDISARARTNQDALQQALARVPLISIVRLNTQLAATKALDAVVEGGMTVVEVTLTTPGALHAIAEARRRYGDEVLVGAGSVRDQAQARCAIDAGSTFLVTPTVRKQVLRLSSLAGVPTVCGAFTPSELDRARRLGAMYQKLFPASRLGPEYLRDVHAPMPDLRLVPTGGVTIENTPDWLAAGAEAVAIGSSLVSQRRADAQQWSEVSNLASDFVRVATNSTRSPR